MNRYVSRFFDPGRKAALVALAALALAVTTSALGAGPGDGVRLIVEKGPAQGQVTLTWEGGAPRFTVYRATSPVGLVDPANELGQTDGRTWTDSPPPGAIVFYEVSSPCVGDPPERCDGIDNDCDGTVDGPGSESSCDLPNATEECQAGTCAIAFCDENFGDCDLDAANGCESDLLMDLAHCGACGAACDPANAAGVCAAGGCEIDSCELGFEDCDAEVATGCEIAIASDPANCGTCGNACSFANASAACVDSGCVLEVCNAGFDDCDLDLGNGCEIATANDPTNCGACGLVCALPNASAGCGAGACVIDACAVDFFDLNGDAQDGCEYFCVFESAIDLPDPGFVDANCDGIDGDAASAVFVSPTGDDANPGTRELPVQTILAGLELAETNAASQVLVDEGSYFERVLVRPGIGLYGGYRSSERWQRSPTVTPTINGGLLSMDAVGITVETIVERVRIESGDVTAPGASTYGVRAVSSPGLVLRNVTVVAGRGQDGTPGQPGFLGANGGGGSQGYAGCENGGFTCSTCPRPPGGTAGQSSCGRPGAPGGSAGLGGNPGSNGGTAPGAGGGSGGLGTPAGQGSWSPTSPYLGQNGASGPVGSDGVPATATFGSTGWFATDGSAGTDGQAGWGGGGGGGGGGGTSSCDSYGGGGGGGGAGGCGGRAGFPGTSGTGSFAVYLWDSNARIQDSLIVTAGGGSGGAGGNGGQGGIGGSGGNCGGTRGNCYGGSGSQDDGSNGGRGGNGGNGGRGGSGGGGAGGPSIGIYSGGTSAPILSGNVFDIGPAGVGGASDRVPGPDGVATTIFPTFCGNLFTDAGEDCDDGNAQDGDGCSSTCRVEAEYLCTGTPSTCATPLEVVFAHRGATTPTDPSEGWTQVSAGPGTSEAPVFGDRGVDAWEIDDDGTVSGSTRSYQHTPTPEQIALAQASGWVLRLRLRIVDRPDLVDFSVFAEYADGVKRYPLQFGQDSAGNAIVTLLDGPSVTLLDLDNGYHLYELVHDPDRGVADLYVNGERRIADYPGVASTLLRVQWGAGQSGSTGEGRYALVEWGTLTCGDGVVDEGESCDDGNLVGGDGCSHACTIEP